MFIRVRGILGANFGLKNAPSSSRLVLGCPEPRSDWVQNGVSLDPLSRLKGIETMKKLRSLKESMFTLDPLSRLKGIETASVRSPLCLSEHTLDPLSRLKGIETMSFHAMAFVPSAFFGSAFPLEGN